MGKRKKRDTKDKTYTYGYGYIQTRVCHHWRQRVRVGEWYVWCSGYMDKPTTKARTGKHPDLGVYLYTGWMTGMGGFASNSVVCPSKSPWPYIVCDWADYSGWYLEDYDRLVQYVTRRIRRGHLIEIGCHGGHGRTGTLLAGCIAVLEGLSAEKAIAAVRKRYCEHTVETFVQEELVYDLLDEQKPEKPTTSWPKSSTTMGTQWPPIGQFATISRGEFYCAFCNHSQPLHDATGCASQLDKSASQGRDCSCMLFIQGDASCTALFCVKCGHGMQYHHPCVCGCVIIVYWDEAWMGDVCECKHTRRSHCDKGDASDQKCRVVDCPCSQWMLSTIQKGCTDNGQAVCSLSLA